MINVREVWSAGGQAVKQESDTGVCRSLKRRQDPRNKPLIVG